MSRSPETIDATARARSVSSLPIGQTPHIEPATGLRNPLLRKNGVITRDWNPFSVVIDGLGFGSVEPPFVYEVLEVASKQEAHRY